MILATQVQVSSKSTLATSSTLSTLPSLPTCHQPSIARSGGRILHYMDASRASLSHLSTELATLICEQLRDIDPASLRQARLVSRSFNYIAMPLSYRTLVLNDYLVQENAEQVCPAGFLDAVRRFTEHVVIPGSLNPAGVRRILACTSHLSSITWRFENDNLQADGQWMPADVLDVPRMKKDATELYVENLPVRYSSAESYLRAVPTDVLVSLKLASPTPPLSDWLSALKDLLLRSRNLKVLHHRDRGQGRQLNFARGERMPPFKELSLKSYDWNHSKKEVDEHWDLSELETLELRSVPYYNFLRSVRPEQLSRLTSLHIDDWSAHLPDHRQEATQLLYDLIQNHIKSLRCLGITCHTDMFPLSALTRHRDLEHLRLRDHVGFGTEDQQCPTLDPRDLSALSGKLPRLRTLELDMDRRQCDPAEFLDAVLEFPRLESLTLHVQTLISVTDEEIPAGDSDYDAATAMLSQLAKGREKTDPDRPWKSITINVGGWEHIMVRRLSQAWQALNERGIYAERCFVMVREGGWYMVREVSNDATAGVTTPDR